MTTATANSNAKAQGISPGQRRALFQAGRRLRLTIDDLRAMTPRGSISALSFQDAAAILNRLNSGSKYEHPRNTERGPRAPKGVYRMVRPAQLRKLEALRIDLGWTAEGLAGFLADRRFEDGRRMSVMNSSADAVAVIELLKAVVVKQARTKERMNSALSETAGPGLLHADQAAGSRLGGPPQALLPERQDSSEIAGTPGHRSDADAPGSSHPGAKR